MTRIQSFVAADTGSRTSAPKLDFLSLFLQNTRWLLLSQPSYLHFQQEEGRSLVEGRAVASLSGQQTLSPQGL